MLKIMSKSNQPPRKRGNQTKYTLELADKICDMISTGKSLRAACRELGEVSEFCVRNWILDDREGFASQYARAKMAQMAALEDDLIEIADQAPPMTESGASDSGWVAHQKLQIDTRKWLMSKIAPKKYGEKLDLQHTGADGGAVEIKQITRVIVDPRSSEAR